MLLTLEAEPARLEVDLESGGRLASLEIAGLPLLVGRVGDAMRWGCYPMAPWAGRVREGRFTYAGKSHALPITAPPHAIHGTVYDRPWRDEGEGELSIDLGEAWPFPGRALQRISLEPDGLSLRLEVHAEHEPFPASLGWHPWFRRDLGRGGPAQLERRARSMYRRDADGIPTGEVIAPPPGPWDDCFSDLASDPVITWPGALRLTLRSTATRWVVYDEPEHALCVEPLTGPPDALNIEPTIVAPGRPLVALASLRWQLL